MARSPASGTCQTAARSTPVTSVVGTPAPSQGPVAIVCVSAPGGVAATIAASSGRAISSAAAGPETATTARAVMRKLRRMLAAPSVERGIMGRRWSSFHAIMIVFHRFQSQGSVKPLRRAVVARHEHGEEAGTMVPRPGRARPHHEARQPLPPGRASNFERAEHDRAPFPPDAALRPDLFLHGEGGPYLEAAHGRRRLRKFGAWRGKQDGFVAYGVSLRREGPVERILPAEHHEERFVAAGGLPFRHVCDIVGRDVAAIRRRVPKLRGGDAVAAARPVTEDEGADMLHRFGRPCGADRDGDVRARDHPASGKRLTSSAITRSTAVPSWLRTTTLEPCAPSRWNG